jgi:hypothetical protein
VYKIAPEVQKTVASDVAIICVVANNRVPFVCRPLVEGDPYGLDMALTHKGEPVIEYYDARYPHTKYGQFVSRYYLETLQEHFKRKSFGIDLCGHEPDWKIDAIAFARTVHWASENIAARLAHH